MSGLKPTGFEPLPVELETTALLTTKKSRTCLVRDVGSGSSAYVLKLYRDSGRARRESEVMCRLAHAGVSVPRPVGVGDYALLRPYVDGQVLRDSRLTAQACRELARWLFNCHAILSVDTGAAALPEAAAGVPATRVVWLVGDMNLGNFVIGAMDDRICGIDFGDTRKGDPYDDVGEGLMRILSHRAGFTRDRWDQGVAFVEEYGRHDGNVEHALLRAEPAAAAAFSQMAIWREDERMQRIAEVFPLLWREAIKNRRLP